MKILSVLLFTITMVTSVAQAQFAGGSGTEEDPYQISTLEQLQAAGDSANLDKHFVQIADIDASDTEEWNNGKGFNPIGRSYIPGESYPFRGSFDGNGFTISNLTINRSEESFVGLFGKTSRANFSHVALENIEVSGAHHTGGLIGSNERGEIHGSYVTGKITGSRSVGGLVGANTGTISESHALIEVTGGGSNYNDGVGGLVGYNNFGMVYTSYAVGTVTGDENVGGLIGQHFGGGGGFSATVHACYAHVDVTGNIRVGGLVGYHALIHRMIEPDSRSIISESYAAGKVSGTDESGGLVGNNEERLLSNYWDEVVTGLEKGVGSGSSNGSMGLTTVQMSDKDAFIHLYELDFEHTWQLTEGYPVLTWQNPEDAVDPPDVPIIRIDTTKRDFGVVGTDSSGTLEVIIRNTGNNVLSGEVNLAGPDVALFAIDDGQFSFLLEVGSSQAVSITFHPEDLKSYEAKLHIVHNAPNRSDTLIIPLVGEGKEPTDVTPGTSPDIPGELALHQNYPNPFNPSTRIRYSLSESAYVIIEVFDITGHHVATLVDRLMPPGDYAADFDAGGLSSGIYMYRIQAGNVVRTRRMSLVK